MELREIAEALYNLSADMDMRDYEEQAESDVNQIVVELESLKDGVLLSVLERVCEVTI